eukprot:3543136-Pyramimonas_sp.AAC.1
MCDAGRHWRLPPILQTYSWLRQGSARAGYPADIIRCCTSAIASERLVTGREHKYQRAATTALYD